MLQSVGYHHGKWRMDLPSLDLLWEPPAVAVTAVFPAGRPPSAPATQEGAPFPPVLFLKLWLKSRARLLQTTGCGDRKGRILTRRYLAPSRGAFNTPGNCSRESACCATAGGYLRTDANVCAQRRCTFSRSSTTNDTTAPAYTNADLPGSYPPAH